MTWQPSHLPTRGQIGIYFINSAESFIGVRRPSTPGDIIFMCNATFERNGEKLKAEEYTAVVHEVKGKGSYVIAEQNWGRGEGVNIVELETKTFRGGLQFFRPKVPPPSEDQE